jgi:hypothetical protein
MNAAEHPALAIVEVSGLPAKIPGLTCDGAMRAGRPGAEPGVPGDGPGLAVPARGAPDGCSRGAAS